MRRLGPAKLRKCANLLGRPVYFAMRQKWGHTVHCWVGRNATIPVDAGLTRVVGPMDDNAATLGAWVGRPLPEPVMPRLGTAAGSAPGPSDHDGPNQ